jgi:hypothetical protein
MNEITRARTAIHDAVVATQGGATALRVHDYPPAQLITPCVFIDMPRITPGTRNLPTTTGQFPVVVAFDGDSTQQVRAMDETAASLWDALNSLDGARVESIDPDPLDIGGPTTRSLVLVVTADLGMATLCPDATALDS